MSQVPGYSDHLLLEHKVTKTLALIEALVVRLREEVTAGGLPLNEATVLLWEVRRMMKYYFHELEVRRANR